MSIHCEQLKRLLMMGKQSVQNGLREGLCSLNLNPKQNLGCQLQGPFPSNSEDVDQQLKYTMKPISLNL